MSQSRRMSLILGDLHRILLEEPEKEARLIATALEIYVTGSLNVFFNHRTNVDIQNRLVCFDIKELGKQAGQLGMLIAPGPGLGSRDHQPGGRPKHPLLHR